MTLRSRLGLHDDANVHVLMLLLAMAFGYLLGGSIQGESKVRDAMQWALGQTAHCENAFKSEGYSSVTECLEFKIWDAEEELRLRQD